MKNNQKLQRQKRVRGKMIGTAEKPRLSVFRSNTHIYAQLIDDVARKTIYGISDKVMQGKNAKKIEVAKEVGMEIAKKAKEKEIAHVIFDRGHYKYHGRVKALAEGAREGGLQF